MKRILSCILVLVLFSGVSLLWAANNHAQEISGHARWARAYGVDGNGPISTFAEIEVDYDYYTEASWPPFRRGYDYSAYANVWGDGFGRWKAYASVPSDEDRRNGLVRGDVYRAVSASHFEKSNEEPNAKEKLAVCSSWSQITVVGHKSRAEANKFE